MTNRATPRVLYLLAVSAWFISSAWRCDAQTGQFHPLDLTPTLYYSSHLTFENPWDVSQCTSPDEPIWGCTGPGTGNLPATIESFVIVDDPSQNRACTGLHTPWPCCNGVYPDPGNTCAYEQPDNARNGLGPPYCPAFRSDGCVNQWIDQTAKKSLINAHPASGIPIEQDDVEKPEFILRCTPTGMPCLRGGPEWDEPLYPPAEDPYQDLIMEFEPADRFHSAINGGGPYWSVQVVRILEQDEDHNLFDATIDFTTARAFEIDTNETNTQVSINDAIPAEEMGTWCIADVSRNALDEITVFVRCENIPLTDVSLVPPAIEPTSQFFLRSQYFCDGKDCDRVNRQQYNGEVAAWFARAAVDGGDPTPQERADLVQYFYDTFLNSPIIFSDGFESGDTSVWSELKVEP